MCHVLLCSVRFDAFAGVSISLKEREGITKYQCHFCQRRFLYVSVVCHYQAIG